MNCFNHSSQPAVGICAGCSKGICADCFSTDVEFLCCNKEACILFAKKSRQMISAYNIETGNHIVKKSHISGIFTSVMIFLMGIWFGAVDTKLSILFIVFGAILFIYNAYEFITKKYQLFKN